MSNQINMSHTQAEDRKKAAKEVPAVFPGVPPYIRAALDRPLFANLGPEDASKAIALGPVMRAQAQLSQAATGPAATRARDADYAKRWRDILALALQGTTDAIAEFDAIYPPEAEAETETETKHEGRKPHGHGNEKEARSSK
jgi:hypothetical protein